MALDNIKTHTSSRRRFFLVVDSDDPGRDYTTKLLERFQYKVLSVRTGGEALEAATAITPVLIVCADRLDDMSGLELIHQFKQDAPLWRVPVIVLTAEKDRTAVRPLLTAGAVACLPTPVSVEDLYRVIQVAIEPMPRMNMRIKTKLPVTIDGRAVSCGEDGCAQTLSEQGAYVRTDHAYPLKSVFPVQIRLGDRTVSADAMVIYCRKERSEKRLRLGIGLQFVNISRPDQMQIRVFIRDELTKGNPLA